MTGILAATMAVGKQALKQVMGENTYFAAQATRQFRRNVALGKQLVFVHQMGKVGSTSLVRSLNELPIANMLALYQTHFLSPTGMAFVEKLEAEGHGGADKVPERTRRFLIHCRTLSQLLQSDALQARRLKVISLVRDPVATNLSGFFYNADWWPPDLQKMCRERAPGRQEQLLNYFLATYPHDVPLTWFDMEMKTVFGVDVFATAFEPDKGYQIYHGNRADLLVLKLEKLDKCAAVAIEEFLGIGALKLLRVNEGADKWYAPFYKEFISQLSLPDFYLDRLYNTSFTHHFYSNAEVLRFKQRWHKELERRVAA